MNARTRSTLLCPQCLQIHAEQCRNVSASPGLTRCLRFALIVGLDRRTAARCLGVRCTQAVRLWPSGLYTMLAHTAAASPEVWHRCQRALDRRFEGAVEHFSGASVFEIANAFSQERELWTSEALAGLLWILAREHDHGAERVAERLSAEFEVAAIAGGRRRE